MKPCAFCQNPVTDPETGRTRSREHVFPYWSLDQLGATRDSISFSRMETTTEGHPSMQLTEQTTFRRFDLNNFLLGNVCSRCNNGWMNSLEQRMKVVFARLDADSVLGAVDRQVLAKWALKTACVLSAYLEPPVGRVLVKHGHQLVGHALTLPKGVSVFYRRSEETRVWFSGSMTFSIQGADRDALWRRYQNAYKMLFQLGRMQFMAMYYPDTNVRVHYAKHLATFAAGTVPAVAEHPMDDHSQDELGDELFRFLMATELRPTEGKVGAGRNDLCPCGSTLKFKHCHGADPSDQRRQPPSRRGPTQRTICRIM